jgi:hypothetical protein
MKIGFFGDSFCANYQNQHSIDNNYSTYIEMLSKKYDAEITNFGVGGSSYWDSILLQFEEQVQAGLPDICVFTWSDAYRLFHRKCRIITPTLTSDNHPLKKQDKQLHSAVQQFYAHFSDQQKFEAEYVSALYYFDNVTLKKYPTTKFIHLWSSAHDDFTAQPRYLYNWKTGVEIRPALQLLATFTKAIAIPNHIEGTLNNAQVYSWIVSAIDNYQDGLLLDNPY